MWGAWRWDLIWVCPVLYWNKKHNLLLGNPRDFSVWFLPVFCFQNRTLLFKNYTKSETGQERWEQCWNALSCLLSPFFPSNFHNLKGIESKLAINFTIAYEKLNSSYWYPRPPCQWRQDGSSPGIQMVADAGNESRQYSFPQSYPEHWEMLSNEDSSGKSWDTALRKNEIME